MNTIDPHKITHTNDTAMSLGREHAEYLSEVAELLAPQDRALLLLTFKYGAPVSTISTAAGVNGSGLYQRLDRLVKRLTGQEARAIFGIRTQIPPHTKDMIISYFIRGDSMNEIMEAHNVARPWLSKLLGEYSDWIAQYGKLARNKSA